MFEHNSKGNLNPPGKKDKRDIYINGFVLYYKEIVISTNPII